LYSSFIIVNIFFLKICLNSIGTPGKQIIFVSLSLINTDGAVPIVLSIISELSGTSAIFD
jgi:hypothetical protein